MCALRAAERTLSANINQKRASFWYGIAKGWRILLFDSRTELCFEGLGLMRVWERTSSRRNFFEKLENKKLAIFESPLHIEIQQWSVLSPIAAGLNLIH